MTTKRLSGASTNGAASGTAEDRLVGTVQSIIRKARPETEQEGPDVIGLAFQFTSGDTATALLATQPPVGLRVDFPIRIVGAHVVEMSDPFITGSASVLFRFRTVSTGTWADLGSAVSFTGDIRADLDDVGDTWQRFLEPGDEVIAKLVSVTTCQSLTATLTARKLPVVVSRFAQAQSVASEGFVFIDGSLVGLPRG